MSCKMFGNRVQRNRILFRALSEIVWNSLSGAESVKSSQGPTYLKAMSYKFYL